MFAHFFGAKGTREAQIPPLSADLGAILSIENGAVPLRTFPARRRVRQYRQFSRSRH
jgi:hypothetical protein